MRPIIVLDSGPAGLGCKSLAKPDSLAFQAWIEGLLSSGVVVCLPEIVDYEVRRKLIHLGAKASVRRLDDLAISLRYDRITTPVMHLAAELWADARRRGRPTSGPRSLDADSILAAQALLLAGPGDVVTVATDNVGHLGQFVDARSWASIT
jgi:predicted nucleic acid-binding protein